METIVLTPLYHRGQESIGIYFTWNEILIDLVKKIPQAKWSRTKQCWYIPFSKKNYELLIITLSGKAFLQTDGLKKIISEKKENNLIENIPNPNKIINRQSNTLSPAKPLQSFHRLSKENKEAFEKFHQQLILKGYSASTIRTYNNELLQFLHAIKNKPADEFSAQRIKDYLQYCFEKLKLSENTLHSRINSLKFYYEQVLNREKFFWEIPRPKKQHQLPKVFSQDEIASIINSVKNKKHKAMLMLAYSAGLRVSEVVALKTYQIDSKRMTIFINNAKGKKDRIVALSPVLLVILREYANEYKPDKKGYLFEGSETGTPYSVRSLQEILAAAKKKAGVIRPGSIHSLRHSFATHLIEKGTDVTMIQKLLGHNDLKTTLIYLHTSNKDLLKIISPLDDLKLK